MVVYFTGDILVATDRLELLCRLSKIWSRAILLVVCHPARGVTVRCYSCYANGFRFDSHLADFCCIFFSLLFFRLRLGVMFRGLVLFQ